MVYGRFWVQFSMLLNLCFMGGFEFNSLHLPYFPVGIHFFLCESGWMFSSQHVARSSHMRTVWNSMICIVEPISLQLNYLGQYVTNQRSEMVYHVYKFAVQKKYKILESCILLRIEFSTYSLYFLNFIIESHIMWSNSSKQ